MIIVFNTNSFVLNNKKMDEELISLSFKYLEAFVSKGIFETVSKKMNFRQSKIKIRSLYINKIITYKVFIFTEVFIRTNKLLTVYFF